ncbi:zinc-binding alcohol dehydrogenase family protein [Nakamurella silvestris]|nr:zinc-binding alcohol dehydrogenase family protein [Nakamurella silvestris]
MYAAVVRDFGRPPRFEQVPEPEARGEHEVVVDVLAAGLHPRVRSQADGSHYTSTDDLPLVPGIDGVGLLPDGRHLYFVLQDTTLGSLAERTVVDLRRSVVLPDDLDPVVLAAAMNPAMSSWVGLRRRVAIRPGAGVLVFGATGNAGRMAVQVARHLGASYIVGAGRSPEALGRLRQLGADATVSLNGAPERVAADLGRAAGEVDIVIDYLWGTAAEAAIPALLTARRDRSRPLDWLQTGSVTGPTAALPSVAFRSANFRLLGSGQGSVSTAGILEELPALAGLIAAGAFTVNPSPVPLSEVERIWDLPRSSDSRPVFVPTRL